MLGKGKITFGKIELSLEPRTQSKEDSSNVTTSGFGSFSSAKGRSVKETAAPRTLSAESEEVHTAMSSMSPDKKARQFDLESLVEETRRSASEKNRERLEQLHLKHEEFKKKIVALEGENTHGSGGDDEFVGPPLPPDMTVNDDEESEEDESRFPITHELSLKHGSKLVSAIAVDPNGVRLVSGSTDYVVKYWDFQGMDLAREAFRSFTPAEGYPVHSVEYSCTGDKVLVVSGSSQAKVYSRDGNELYECVKGDMYLYDMAKTKGHVAGLTGGHWHPRDKEEFQTTAADGTCRLWDVGKMQQKNVIKTRAKSGLKALPTACNYSRDGNLISCACTDGTIQIWDGRRTFVSPSIHIKDAHQNGTEISCIQFSHDGNAFATRGGDDTLKLWDTRNCKTPLFTADDLFTRFSMTECTFSPDDKFILTGVSLSKGETTGKLYFFDRSNFNIVKTLHVGPSHIVRIKWHPKLNQLMVGCGDGMIRILYDPDVSHNGAILVAGKHKRRAKQAEVVVSQQIITPHALPMFREERHRSTRKMEEKDRKDPVKSHQPELPVGKAGSGGRVASGGSTLSSYIIRNMGLRNKAKDEDDPREALLKYAKAAEEDPYWVAPAYAKTQPKPIFQEADEEEDQPHKKQKLNPV